MCKKELILTFDGDRNSNTDELLITATNITSAGELLRYLAAQDKEKASPEEKQAFADLASNCEEFLRAYEYYKNRL